MLVLYDEISTLLRLRFVVLFTCNGYWPLPIASDILILCTTQLSMCVNISALCAIWFVLLGLVVQAIRSALLVGTSSTVAGLKFRWGRDAQKQMSMCRAP